MGTRAVVALGVVSVVGWGAAAGLGAALLVLGAEDGPRQAVGPDPAVAVPGTAGGEPPSPGAQADTYELTVHSDGCGVVRTEGPDGQDLDGLTWSVLDADGFEVLGRNALGETRYRYFSAGTFDVVLEAWGDDAYVPVSNTVTITC